MKSNKKATVTALSCHALISLSSSDLKMLNSADISQIKFQISFTPEFKRPFRWSLSLDVCLKYTLDHPYHHHTHHHNHHHCSADLHVELILIVLSILLTHVFDNLCQNTKHCSFVSKYLHWIVFCRVPTLVNFGRPLKGKWMSTKKDILTYQCTFILFKCLRNQGVLGILLVSWW